MGFVLWKLYFSAVLREKIIIIQQTPINEKEYNGNLLDQISLLDDIERVNCKEVLDEITYKRNQINRKLYQKPSLTDGNN